MYSFEICPAKLESSVDLAYLCAAHQQINIWQTPGCCLCNSVANGDKSYPLHVKKTTSSGSTLTFNSPDKDITRKQKGVLPLGTFRMKALSTTCTVDLCTRPPPTLLRRSKIVLLCPGGPNISLKPRYSFVQSLLTWKSPFASTWTRSFTRYQVMLWDNNTTKMEQLFD